jgi:hypothetical protein
MIIEKERRRLIMNLNKPLPFRGFAFNFQSLLIESCISPNTLVAPMIREDQSNDRCEMITGTR